MGMGGEGEGEWVRSPMFSMAPFAVSTLLLAVYAGGLFHDVGFWCGSFQLFGGILGVLLRVVYLLFCWG